MSTKIRGIEGMKHGELDFEIQRGAKFVLFQYCISLVVLTFRRPSDIYLFSPPGRKRRGKGPAVHPAVAGRRLVGHPVGTDLHHAVRLQQFTRRQRRHIE
jgi:hypothetical protein